MKVLDILLKITAVLLAAEIIVRLLGDMGFSFRKPRYFEVVCHDGKGAGVL